MDKINDLECDVLVVGSGVVGALVAWKCARQGKNVLMVERGPELTRTELLQRMWTRGTDYVYPDGPEVEIHAGEDPEAIPSFFQALSLAGGTTWHWGGVCPRFLPVDFRLASVHGIGMDWPLSYEEVEPYYREAEREMGIAGAPGSQLPFQPITWLDQQVMNAGQRIGLDIVQHPVARMSESGHDRPPCQGFNSCTPLCPSGAMYAGILHVEKARAAGARLLTGCTVVKLRKGRGGQLEGAEARRADRSRIRLRARCIVLAANALENARLLMLSGLCARSKKWLGAGAMTHPSLTASFQARKPMDGGRGPRQSVWWPGGRDGEWRQDMAAHHFLVSNHVEPVGKIVRSVQSGLLGKKLAQSVIREIRHDVSFYLNTEQLPALENRLEWVSGGTDASGLPQVRVCCRMDEYARRGMARLREHLGHLAAAMGADEVRYHRPQQGSHLMGTTRMALHPDDGVVDGEGRSFDHENLWIAGSSVFVTGSTANPTLTAAALALRTADALLRSS